MYLGGLQILTGKGVNLVHPGYFQGWAAAFLGVSTLSQAKYGSHAVAL